MSNITEDGRVIHQILMNIPFLQDENEQEYIDVDGQRVAVNNLTMRAGYNGYSNVVAEIPFHGVVSLTSVIIPKIAPNTLDIEDRKDLADVLRKALADNDVDVDLDDEQLSNVVLKVAEHFLAQPLQALSTAPE